MTMSDVGDLVEKVSDKVVGIVVGLNACFERQGGNQNTVMSCHYYLDRGSSQAQRCWSRKHAEQQ